MVIQWHTHHKDNPHHPEDNENKEKWTDDISEYLNNFLKVDQGTWFDLTLAANYLEIKDLLDLQGCCQYDQGGNWRDLKDIEYQKWFYWIRGNPGMQSEPAVWRKVKLCAKY